MFTQITSRGLFARRLPHYTPSFPRISRTYRNRTAESGKNDWTSVAPQLLGFW